MSHHKLYATSAVLTGILLGCGGGGNDPGNSTPTTVSFQIQPLGILDHNDEALRVSFSVNDQKCTVQPVRDNGDRYAQCPTLTGLNHSYELIYEDANTGDILGYSGKKPFSLASKQITDVIVAAEKIEPAYSIFIARNSDFKILVPSLKSVANSALPLPAHQVKITVDGISCDAVNREDRTPIIKCADAFQAGRIYPVKITYQATTGNTVYAQVETQVIFTPGTEQEIEPVLIATESLKLHETTVSVQLPIPEEFYEQQLSALETSVTINGVECDGRPGETILCASLPAHLGLTESSREIAYEITYRDAANKQAHPTHSLKGSFDIPTLGIHYDLKFDAQTVTASQASGHHVFLGTFTNVWGQMAWGRANWAGNNSSF